MQLTIEIETQGWAGFALSPSGNMVQAGGGTPAIIAEEENGLLQLKGYVLGGKSSAQHTPVDLAACGVDLTGATATKIGTTTRMTFGLKYSGEAGGGGLPPPGGGGGIGGSPPPPPIGGGVGGGVGGGTCGTASSDLTIPRDTPLTGVIMASGLLPGFLASNGHLGGEGGRLAAQALSADGGSGAGASNAALIVVHGLLMVTSWVVLAPLGFMMARYERARPPTGWWFKWHRALMLAAVSCTLVGFVFALILVNGVHFNSTHAQCGTLGTRLTQGASCAQPHSSPPAPPATAGLTFFLFMLLQPLNGLLRPKHEAKWRRPWELFHKSLGYFLLLFAMLTAILGSLESGGGAAVVAPLIIVIVLVVGVLAFREFRACKGKSGPYGAGGGGGGGPALQQGGGGGLPPGWSSAIDPNSGRASTRRRVRQPGSRPPRAAAGNPPPPPGPPPLARSGTR